MAVSSSVLFHFPNSMDNLINILTNEFQPRFCLEDLGQLFPKLEKDIYEQAIPMVCFCDLRLSNVKEHLRFYGNYGLGLNKEWGIGKGINPVIYLCPASPLCEHIFDILSTFVDDEETRKLIEDFNNITGFVKPHEGLVWRDGEYHEKYCYDEREWRYIPRFLDGKVLGLPSPMMRKEEFMNKVKRGEIDAPIENIEALTFEPKDITYIMVERESEILPMINAIKHIKGRYDTDTVSVLSTRIICSEQVIEDF